MCINTPAIRILHEDGPCLVVYKPPGLLTQAPPGIDSLESRIKATIRQRDNRPGKVYLGIPHRIDRPASGVMVFARHVRAARRISEQFENRLVKKVYWALVEGIVEPDRGTWIDTIRKIPGQARAELVEPDHPEGKEAILHYETIGRTGHGSWLQIQLETGRTHQIRVQAASRGHAVLGDASYGASVPFGVQHDDERLRAIALHAQLLELEHPMTREKVSVTAAPPEEWEEV